MNVPLVLATEESLRDNSERGHFDIVQMLRKKQYRTVYKLVLSVISFLKAFLLFI